MRIESLNRNTTETQIDLKINLDGTGSYKGEVNCGFLSHMLELFSKHGRFDLSIKAKGDIHVDYHHLTEDAGIALGRAISDALGERRGIKRYGSFIMPMDESLVMAAVDISGRSYLGYNLSIPSSKVGDFDTELTEEFFLGFVRGLGCTLHLKQMAGGNSHHIIEAAFKGFGRALKEAVSIDEDYKDEIISTKGTIL